MIKKNGQDYGQPGAVLNLHGSEMKSVEQLFDLIKSQLKFKRMATTKVYSPQGIMLHDDDVLYLRNGDILYYDYKGKEFDTK